MTISFVGAVSGNALNGGNVSLNVQSTAGAIDGDYVWIISGAFGRAGTEGRIGNALSYTQITDNTNTIRCRSAGKIYASADGATVTVEGSANTADTTVAVALVFRGVDSTTPIDATTIVATGSSTNPNPGSITPVRGSTAFIAAAVSGVSDASPGTVTGYTQPTNFATNGNDTNAATAAASYKISTANPAAEDPAAYSSWSNAAWVALTVALRPAATALAANSGTFVLGGANTDFIVPGSGAHGDFLLGGAPLGDVSLGEIWKSGSVTTTLAANSGAFALAGGNAVFKYTFVSASGTYTLVGGAAIFTTITVTTLAAASGTFVLAGGASVLTVVLGAATGTFVLSGKPAIFPFSLIGNSGSFVFTYNDAIFRSATVVAANSGTFALAGGAGLFKVVMPGASGTFALAGGAAVFKFTLPSASGTFVLGGAAANLTFVLSAASRAFVLAGGASIPTIVMPGASGTFVLSGGAASFVSFVNMIGASGTFVLTGGAAALSPLGAYSSGQFILTGGQANFRFNEASASGTFVLGGSASGFTVVLSAGSGTFALAGGAASFSGTVTTSLVANSGTFVLVGQDANLFQVTPTIPMVAESGTFTTVGGPATLGRFGIVYDFPIGKSIDSDYGLRRARRIKLIIGRR